MSLVSAPPVLNRLQQAWLLEIGMDARLLGRYAADEAGPVQACAAASSDEAAARARTGQPAPAMTGAADAAAITVEAAAAAIAIAPAVSGGRAAMPDAAAARKQPTPLASMRTALLSGKPVRQSQRPAQEAPAAEALDTPIIDVSGVHDMASLRALASSCQACALHEGRSRVVFGAGKAERPRLLIVGEAPGDHDDRVGEPFQGPTGKLLHAMLDAVGIDPAGSVFYTNIVKCRPLAGRPAQAPEVQSCRPYLLRQIDLLKPRSVLALGRMAALALMGGDGALESLRGRVHYIRTADGGQVALVATHHPASLLLRARQKAEVWADLNVMRQALPGDD